MEKKEKSTAFGRPDTPAVFLKSEVNRLLGIALWETASGLNEDRKKLHGMLEMAEGGGFSVLLAWFKDRLTRFGFRYLEDYLSYPGVRIYVVGKRGVKSPLLDEKKPGVQKGEEPDKG